MRIALITGSRSDWRMVEPLLVAARADDAAEVRLIVTGTHLSPRHGHTVDHIERRGWRPAVCVPIVEDRDTPLAVSRATGRAVAEIAAAVEAERSDWTVVAGDRYESFAAGLAATMLGIPLVHIGGGETDVATNQDGNMRNALSKLAQLHCVAHKLAATRLRALGEENWRVQVTGLPSLDGLREERATWSDLVRFGIESPDHPFILASFLPVTLRPDESRSHLQALLGALSRLTRERVLFVLSNGDAGGDAHDAAIRTWAERRANVALASDLSPDLYQFALRHCACYVGNSSSGVIEAPVHGTPVVLVGSRQEGRPRAQNVRDVANPTPSELHEAIALQLRIGRYHDSVSPWGDGRSGPRILRLLHAKWAAADLMNKRLIVAEERACALSV